MTYLPKYIKEYPNMYAELPLHISLNRLIQGYPAHRHDFLEFSYVVDGHGSETINGISHPMEPGVFTFVLPYQIHEIYTEPGKTLTLYNCMFSMDLLVEHGNALAGGLYELLHNRDHLPGYHYFEDDEHVRMLDIIQDIYQEYQGDGSWRKELVKAKLGELLIRFDRARHAAAASVMQKEAFQPGRSNIWPIIHYIHQHAQEPLTLTGVAERFGISPSHLSETLKKTTGQSFVPLVHDIRIRHACSLLSSTEMSVAEVAYEVGYGSYKTFHRIFAERKGMVPTQYRKLNTKL
ncbi:AraC family transcriptional regulator [Xylanibacillus composti]|uniref:Transcriptional regulator n=1 Tax=Xylanibacillus composti TaxID=1572762 RepID=A0A8J4H6H3_9BACL|nr:AraC family transcriptional regulator [Xylanibacillus composti]MDT9726690.1 AraC family transcriptional regulator [Xylanibacillus composti]GIQ69378.1 transcriptional regulator [Xylanibacillus composti]